MNPEPTNEPLDVIDPTGSPAGVDGRRRWLRATAVAALVAAGGVGSWALAQPSSSTAQSAGTETATDAGGDAAGGRFGRKGHGPGLGLDAAAEALGLTAEELRTQLHAGATLAEIAAERDVAVDDLIAAIVSAIGSDIDAKVAAGDIDEDRATDIKANLTERVTAMVNGEMRMGGEGGPGGHGGHGGPGQGHGHGRGAGLETAADVLGLEVDALRTQLREGASLAEIAEAQGIDVDTLIDALVEDARERITAMVNGERPEPDSTNGSGETTETADPAAA